MKKTVKEKIARWLWRRDKNEGQMVGTFEEHKDHWMKEANKIISISMRMKQK